MPKEHIAIDEVEVLDSDISFDDEQPEEPAKDGDDPDKEPDTDPDGEDPDKDPDDPDAEPGDDSDDSDDEPETIKIGEDEYSEEDLSEALADRKNKKEWSKANTEKAQAIAEDRKAIEPVLQFAEMVRKNTDFIDVLKETVEEEFGEDGTKLLEAVLSTDKDSLVNPFKDEYDQAVSELDQIKAEVSLNKAKAELKKTFKLKETEVEEVVNYAVKILEDTGRLITLEEAYKVMNFERKSEEKKSKPKPPKSAKKSRGAKKIEDQKKTAKTYEDIKMDGFDLFGA